MAVEGEAEGTKVSKYYQVTAGEWVQPIRKGYKLACCDCGLVHRVNFKIVKRGKINKIQFQAFRDEKASASLRRGVKYKGLRLPK